MGEWNSNHNVYNHVNANHGAISHFCSILSFAELEANSLKLNV